MRYKINGKHFFKLHVMKLVNTFFNELLTYLREFITITTIIIFIFIIIISIIIKIVACF